MNVSKVGVRRRDEQAGVVFGMLVVIGVVGVLLIAYLSMVSQRAGAAARSQSWNLAVPVAEAGLEEAMAHLNHTAGKNMGSNGWLPTPPNKFVKPSYNMGAGSYSVEISNVSPPVMETLGSVQSRGAVNIPGTGTSISRTFTVTTRYRPEVKGIVARTSGVVAGTIRADSYDSTSSLYSSNGVYVPSRARDNSFIGSASTMAATLEVTGGANIYGSVGTGAPGGLKTPLPSPTKIGDAAFISSGSSGLQSGHYSTGLSVPLSTIPNPPFTTFSSPLANSPVGGTNYFRVLHNGNYKIVGTLNMAGSGAGAQKMMVTGNANLWITDTWNLDADAEVIIAPNARLTLYMEKQFYCKGRAKLNIGGRPDQFAYYGMTANAECYIEGDSKISAILYAPQAKLVMAGNSEFSGAALCNILDFTGFAQFHYDESLAETKGQPFIITSWREL